MNRSRKIKIRSLETRHEYVIKEIEIGTWYYRLLLWLFKSEEGRIEKIIKQAEDAGWERGFIVAREIASSSKERAMKKKLFELGYEVVLNFPIAKFDPGIETSNSDWSPEKSWEIIKK